MLDESVVTASSTPRPTPLSTGTIYVPNGVTRYSFPCPARLGKRPEDPL